MMLITAMHNGELRTLSVPQWSELLNVSKKHLWNRKRYGYSDQETIQGDFFELKKKKKIPEEELAGYYKQFNFNMGIYNGLRQ